MRDRPRVAAAGACAPLLNAPSFGSFVTPLAKIGSVVAALVAMTVSVLVAVDVAQDRGMKVSITGSVPLYPDWDAGPQYQTAIGEIGPSTSAKVLRVRYGKDFEAIKLRTD